MSGDAPLIRPFHGDQDSKAGRLVEHRNPARPALVVARSVTSTAEDVRHALTAAKVAFEGWAARPAAERSAFLYQVGGRLEANAAVWGRDMATEMGKTASEAAAEFRRAAAIFRYYAGQATEPTGETYASSAEGTHLYSDRMPLGVVTLITPWNFPVAIPAWKIAPALAYGNTVVWKPSELTPLTASHLLSALRDSGLPEGTVAMILGTPDDFGDALLTSPDVAGVSFTGSTEVGRAVLATASAHGKPAQIEMGGKNAAVILADADLDQAVEQVSRAAFLSAGQKCTSTSRVIIESAVFDQVVAMLCARAQAFRLGDPLLPDTEIGPVASLEQFLSISDHLARAERESGEFLVNGRREGHDEEADGYYIGPTVLIAPEGAAIHDEEVFGPVITVTRVADRAAAVRAANQTQFGLAVSLFTRDLDAAFTVSRQLLAGVVKVNQESGGLEYHVPFGGTSASSYGPLEQGQSAREFYTRRRTVYLTYASR